MAGSKATATCAAEGSEPIRFEWLKDGQPVNMESVNIGRGDVMSTILFKSLRSTHAGNYSCVASNGFGSDTFTAQLSVQSESLVGRV